MIVETWPDWLHPMVLDFEVSPTSVTFGESFKIDYMVSSNCSEGLKQVELWRKDESIDWQQISTNVLAGETGPVSGSFTDSPAAPGKYWYGVHVVDNAGNWNNEKNSNTNYQPEGFESEPVEVKQAEPTKDYSDLEQESIRKVREMTDAYLSLASTYGSAFSYSIVDARSFDSKTDVARYLNDVGITYESTLETLNIIDTYGLESTGFCLVIVEYNMAVFGENMRIMNCAVCDEKGVPIGYEAFQGLMQGYS
jgi:hypothetical protein